MQAREWSKSLLIGALIGVVLFAAALGYAVFRQRSAQSALAPDRVAVILVSRDASDAPVAQAIAIAQRGTLRFISPDTEVVVPGTSARRLADAYSFGGGDLVVSLLPDDASVAEDAYIAIPEQAWLTAIGSEGIDVEVPQRLEVFDGEQLLSLKAGRQQVKADEVAALFRALPYVKEGEREELREELARATFSAVGDAPEVPGVESPLSDSAVRQLVGSL